MTLAVMGCVVNGPGESKAANIGISLPGYWRGAELSGLHRRQAPHRLRGTYEELAVASRALVDEYVENTPAQTLSPARATARLDERRSCFLIE